MPELARYHVRTPMVLWLGNGAITSLCLIVLGAVVVFERDVPAIFVLLALALCSLCVAFWFSMSAYRVGGGRNLIRFYADRIEVQDRADRAIFAGNVKVRQAELTLDAERLTVAYSSEGGVQIRRLDWSPVASLLRDSKRARRAEPRAVPQLASRPTHERRASIPDDVPSPGAQHRIQEKSERGSNRSG